MNKFCRHVFSQSSRAPGGSFVHAVIVVIMSHSGSAGCSAAHGSTIDSTGASISSM
jgi:hypothetical protein